MQSTDSRVVSIRTFGNGLRARVQVIAGMYYVERETAPNRWRRWFYKSRDKAKALEHLYQMPPLRSA